MKYINKIERGLLAAALLLLPTLASAGAPAMVPIQGYITGDDGEPLPGPVEVEIRLFGAEVGGTSLFTEIHPDVPVNDGVFVVMLGASVSLPTTIWDQAEVWVQTEVDNQTLAPRRRLGSTPFALRAAVADVALNAGTADEDWVIDGTDVYRAGGRVGVGNTNPLRRMHLGTGLGITDGDLTEDDILVEDADAYLGLYSNNNGSEGSGITMGEIEGGNLADRWTIKRRTTFGGSDLDFVHTETGSPSTQVLRLSPSGRVGINTTEPATELQVIGDARANTFNATQTLGDTDTPTTGAIYADNVIYAWGQINGAGQVEQGFGIESVTRYGPGHYEVVFKNTLSGAVIPVVTAFSSNNIVNARVATVAPDRCEVKLAVWSAAFGDFQDFDFRFLLQVVGRP